MNDRPRDRPKSIQIAGPKIIRMLGWDGDGVRSMDGINPIQMPPNTPSPLASNHIIAVSKFGSVADSSLRLDDPLRSDDSW